MLEPIVRECYRNQGAFVFECLVDYSTLNLKSVLTLEDNSARLVLIVPRITAHFPYIRGSSISTTADEHPAPPECKE